MSENVPYYRKSIFSNAATNLTITARQSMVDLFFNVCRLDESHTVLDLGVTSERDPSANYLEKNFPFPHRLTCAGMQDAGWLADSYPGIKFVLLEPGKPLPFKDQEFDFVYSNAVVELVGSKEDQVAFIGELLRVSKNFFLTTPNRWFPVEMHTHIPLLHLFPQKIFRYFLKLKGEKFYAQEKNLNLLTRRDVKRIFPVAVKVNSRYIYTLGFPSNIVVYGESTPLATNGGMKLP